MNTNIPTREYLVNLKQILRDMELTCKTIGYSEAMNSMRLGALRRFKNFVDEYERDVVFDEVDSKILDFEEFKNEIKVSIEVPEKVKEQISQSDIEYMKNVAIDNMYYTYKKAFYAKYDINLNLSGYIEY